MSILIGATMPGGAVLMADTFATYNPNGRPRERIPEGQDKLRELGPEVWAALAGRLPSSDAVAESLARDFATLTTPAALRDAQEARVAATWDELTARPPADEAPGSVAVAVLTVGVRGDVPFLAGSFRHRRRPDFRGPFYARPWATWILGMQRDLERDDYYRDFLAALDKRPRDPVAAILGVGMRTILRIAEADPTYQRTPVQAVVIRQGEPVRRLLLVASDEGGSRVLVLEAPPTATAAAL